VESAFCSCLACSIASSFRISYPRGLPAPIMMHRRDAHRRHHFLSSSGSIYATGIGNGSTRSTDGNPEPRERQRRSGGLRLVLSRKSKSSEIGRSRERLDSLRAPTDAARTDPPALTRGGRVRVKSSATLYNYRIPVIIRNSKAGWNT
jgi:hypothetical protein